MEVSIRVNEVKKQERKENAGGVRAFATLVFGDSFKITNVAIVENKEKKLFVSMPRYKSNEKDENGEAVYKNVCNPITAEFREELYGKILDTYEQVVVQGKEPETIEKSDPIQMPEFMVKVSPYERKDSNIRGLVRVYFEDEFIVNNITLLQGKQNVFVAMPSYKTKQKDDQGNPQFQDVVYPVTKEFREKLYGKIIEEYEMEKEKQKEKNQQKNEKEENSHFHKDREEKEQTPFR